MYFFFNLYSFIWVEVFFIKNQTSLLIEKIHIYLDPFLKYIYLSLKSRNLLY